MSDEYKGDLIYVDPYGNRWRITQKAARNNAQQFYWHADLISGGNAHRVSVSARRLLMGIDEFNWESDRDGGKESGSEKDNNETLNEQNLSQANCH